MTNYFNQELRLSLTSGVPVTVADVTAATTIYLVPYVGNSIGLYDGVSTWNLFTTSQLSIAVPNVANQMYDVWCYNNAGTPTLEVLAWTSDTARATALARQDGVQVKSTDTTRRYLGSFRTLTAGQTEDSDANRLLANYYNRVMRRVFKAYDATTWTYNSYGAWRSANNSTANRVSAVACSGNEDTLDLYAEVNCAGGTSTTYLLGWGANSTTTLSPNSVSTTVTDGATANIAGRTAYLNISRATGYAFYQVLEYIVGSTNTVTVTTLNNSVVSTYMYGNIYQ